MPEEVTLDESIGHDALRAALRRTLPEHMVPSRFVGLRRLPLTSSGKVDRKALPDVDATVSGANFTPPCGETETAVAATFAELLELPEVGANDNFFDLGGHSLMALQLVARITQRLERNVPVRMVFEHPTVRRLAEAIEGLGTDTYEPLISFADIDRGAVDAARLPYLFCVHPGSGHALMYERLVKPLATVARVVGIQARGVAVGETSFDSYEEMVSTYHDVIKRAAAGAPLYLLGWSLGGYVAQDVAARLAAEGVDVKGLVIVDSVDRWRTVFPDEARALDETRHDFEAWFGNLLRDFYPEAEARFDAAADRFGRLRVFHDAAVAGSDIEAGAVPSDPEILERFFENWHQLNHILQERPASSAFPGRTLLFRASDTVMNVPDPTFHWSAVCGPLQAIDVPIQHTQMMRPEPAAIIAGVLQHWLTDEAPRTERHSTASKQELALV